MRSAWLGLSLFGFMFTSVFTLAQDEHVSISSDSGVQMIVRTTQAVDYRRGQSAELQSQQVDEAWQQAQAAQQRAQQAETQQQQLRQQLRDQLNQILETRDTARGLIVSMPDVLFDTGSATLKATARERLAKVSGILIAHPDIRVEVDGYADSTGDPSFNEQLPQQRAASVQSYLTQQGVPSSSISTHGFGQANPIASNDTAAG